MTQRKQRIVLAKETVRRQVEDVLVGAGYAEAYTSGQNWVNLTLVADFGR